MALKHSFTTSDYLPYSEYKRLVENLEKDGDYRGAAYCVLSFSTALRVSDVLKIKWCQIIGHTNLVITEQKTKKTKDITIGPKTEQKIHELYFKLGKGDYNGYVVANYRGLPMSRQFLNRALKDYKEKYNLKIGNFSTHTFRKTFGRYVYEKMGKTQESLILLQRIFRHGNISTTLVYLGIRDDEIKDIFRSIG